ncbi:hypothetical protein DND132_2737 [Pseudodesulfovibrio mercurii]|uniref:Uncharacterized protein n=1 Tax=Pseudodesulfovibrio mercurii TaxID=641491 RepID=F0JJ41_9BACT|nr:hypothetical protein DND132_2737 [Pseudodesulfovibrio mercurii]
MIFRNRSPRIRLYHDFAPPNHPKFYRNCNRMKMANIAGMLSLDFL